MEIQGNLSSEQLRERDEVEKKIEEIMNKNREFIKEQIKTGKLPEISPLSRKLRRAMDAAGANMGKTKADDKRTLSEIRDDMCDWILDNAYKDFDFSEIDDAVCRTVALFTYRLTFRDELGEKNF